MLSWIMTSSGATITNNQQLKLQLIILQMKRITHVHILKYYIIGNMKPDANVVIHIQIAFSYFTYT